MYKGRRRRRPPSAAAAGFELRIAMSRTDAVFKDVFKALTDSILSSTNLNERQHGVGTSYNWPEDELLRK